MFVLQGTCQTAVDCCVGIAGYVSDPLSTMRAAMAVAESLPNTHSDKDDPET